MTEPSAETPLPSGAPPHLDHEALAVAQTETLASKRRKYAIAARLLFFTLDLFYGRRRTLSKFKVLELIARVPYQAWEQAAYIAITHVHEQTGLARRIYDRVRESRAQQDNEQWHLLVLDEIITNGVKDGRIKEGRIKYFWLPQLIAFFYYQLSWIMYVIHPVWSYRLNADFEDHAEHEYAHLVAENPEWETIPFESELRADYGDYDSQADVFRQIGHDERVHKLESELKIRDARFH